VPTLLLKNKLPFKLDEQNAIRGGGNLGVLYGVAFGEWFYIIQNMV